MARDKIKSGWTVKAQVLEENKKKMYSLSADFAICMPKLDLDCGINFNMHCYRKIRKPELNVKSLIV